MVKLIMFIKLAKFKMRLNIKIKYRYKNGKEIKDNKRIRVEVLDDKTYRLVIGSASKEDQGNYKVEAKNHVGQADSSAELTIKVRQIHVF